MRDSKRNYPWNVERAAGLILSWLKYHLRDGRILMDEPEWQELVLGLAFITQNRFLFLIKKSWMCSDTTRYMLQWPRRRKKVLCPPESRGWVRLTNATAWHRAETGAAKSIPGAISWCLSKLTEEVYINITWLSSAAFVSTAHLELLPCWAAWGTGRGGRQKKKKKARKTYLGF